MRKRTKARIGALEIADAIADKIGSYVDMNFIQFLPVDGDRIHCWYMNANGAGPSFGIDLHWNGEGWSLDLQEHPAGTDQQIEIA